MPGPTTTPKPKLPNTPKPATEGTTRTERIQVREKHTERMWREAQQNAQQGITSPIAEPESMSIIAFILVLLPTAFLLDLFNLLDISVVGAIVPYITDFTFGLALSFGLWLAGNKDPMQLAIAGVSLLICLFPALRDFFPWTIAICAGFIISLPFMQRMMGRVTEIAGEVTGDIEQVKQTVRTVKKGLEVTSKLTRAPGLK